MQSNGAVTRRRKNLLTVADELQRKLNGGAFNYMNASLLPLSYGGDIKQLLAASGDGTVRLHRTTSDNDILTFTGSDSYQHSVAATPDGRFVIACGSARALRVQSGHERGRGSIFGSLNLLLNKKRA